ncbi:MAG TPA: MoxR family ATPase [Phaeodactylibacter sp.]|nr:MoxR family ATPase [Phaeodactylibacter sp.]
MEEQFSSPSPYEPDEHWTGTRLDLRPLQDAAETVRTQMQKVIIGQYDLIDQLLVALFAGGHVLIEGVPGIAKTLIARMLARSLKLEFSRLQFTPDLMPSDVLGTTVFNMKESDFSFVPGPIFAQLVLIDEINRAPAKTQSALFEVMEEHQATVDGVTYPLGELFFVIATQNPIEQEGTYRLPEAQLDRFFFMLKADYPNLDEEKAILHRFASDFDSRVQEEVQPVLGVEDILKYRSLIEKIYIRRDLLSYIAEVVHKTREHPDLFLGASPRASLTVMKAAKALAGLNGRDFVTPDDIREVTYLALQHRIILTPEREMEGLRVEQVVAEILEQIEVPR